MPADRVSSRRLALPLFTPGALDRYRAALQILARTSETLAITTPPIGGVKRSSRTDPEQARRFSAPWQAAADFVLVFSRCSRPGRPQGAQGRRCESAATPSL